MAEPYIKKNPNDIIRAQDWNDIQGMGRDDLHGHDHSGGDKGPKLTGAGIDPAARISVASADISGSLKVNARDILAEVDKLVAGIGAKFDNAGGTLTGGLTVKGELVAAGNLRLNDQTIFLRTDANHGLAYRSTFATQSIDGPALFGYSGGVLGTMAGGEKAALSWNTTGQVQVGGAIVAGNSDIYFSNTTHIHTGRGNTEGWAAIENDSRDHKALMILGRQVASSGGRQVKLFDHLEVSGTLTVTQQEGWIAPRMESNWVKYDDTYNPAGYYKDSLGVVHLRGLVKGGARGTVVFTLPAGYRPQFQHLFTAQTDSNTSCRCDLYPDGRLVATTGNSGWVSLDNLSFRAV